MDTAPEQTKREREIKRVQAAIIARRLRDKQFPDGLFGEPAWDCLLHIYLAFLEKRRTSVAEVCEASTAPPTTSMRWLNVLCQIEFVVRSPEGVANSVIIELAPEGVAQMSRYFDQASSVGSGG